jgi:hypothetical protein
MMQLKDYRRDVNDVGLAGPLLKIPGSADGCQSSPGEAMAAAARLRHVRGRARLVL